MDGYYEAPGYRKRVVEGVFLLKEDGLPLIGRVYSNKIGIEPIMFSGLISALRTFSISSIGKEIIDVGMEGSRLFFKKHDEIIAVVMIMAPTGETRFYIPKQLSLAIDELLEEIISLYLVVNESFGRDSEREQDLMATLGIAIDQILNRVFDGKKTIDEYLALIPDEGNIYSGRDLMTDHGKIPPSSSLFHQQT